MELAGQFGGGGHKKASGFTMPGRLHREIRWKVKPVSGAESLDGNQKTMTVPDLNKPINLLGDILQISSLVKEN
jgi:hypothetical protein